MNQTIETERCFLKTVTNSDKDDIYSLYKNIHVREFLGGIISETEFIGRFPKMICDPNQNWAIRLQNSQFIGLISINRHHDGLDQEMSYQFLPEFWHQGFAKEVCQTMINYASEKLNLYSIVSETQSANISSRKLLEKLGMKPEKTALRFGVEQIIYRKIFK